MNPHDPHEFDEPAERPTDAELHKAELRDANLREEILRNDEAAALDRLLADAQWPEPSPGAVARLSHTWQAIVAQNAPSTLPVPTVPLPQLPSSAGFGGTLRVMFAAAALLLLGTALLLWRGFAGTSSMQVQSAPPETARKSAALTSPSPQPHLNPPSLAPAASSLVDVESDETGRLPTPYELVIEASSRRPPARPNRARRPQPKTRTLALVRAIIAAQLRPVPLTAVSRTALIRRVRTTTGDEQVAALISLVPLATERDLPLLRDAYAVESLRQAALVGLLRLESSSRLVALAVGTDDESICSRLLIALCERGDPNSMQLFWEASTQPFARNLAPAALAHASPQLIELVLDSLSAPVPAADRVVIAELLGKLNRPEISERLISLTANPALRNAALAGLVSSQDPLAQQFVSAAEQDQQLVASVWMVQQRNLITNAQYPGELQHATP